MGEFPESDLHFLHRGCAAALVRGGGASVEVKEYSSSQEGLVCCSWVSNWFPKLSIFDTLLHTAKEKFGWLDEDEPAVIQVALQDETFIHLLEQFFHTGDTHNVKHRKTLATLSGICGGKSLLHYCCENNFVRCVDLLLSEHCRNQLRLKKPWLQLCDPIWKDRHNYENTA